MKIQYIKKTTNLIYVWVFFPTFFNINEKVIHEIEHKLFFFNDLKKLLGGNYLFSTNNIEAGGTAYYSGIRLEFTLISELLPKLLSTLQKMIKSPLPDWTKEEALRFQKEIDEDDLGDSFFRLSLLYKENILKINKNTTNLTPATIWQEAFDFKNTGILILGDLKHKLNLQNWNRKVSSKLATDFCEQKLINWYAPIETYNYNIFLNVTGSPQNYVLLKIMQNILYESLTKQYLNTGRAYDLDLQNYYEKEFIIAGFDINTNDTVLQKPTFLSNITKKHFQQAQKYSIFEELSDDDALAYGCFPILGFTPNEVKQAYHNLTYEQFCDFYSKKLKEISIYWC